MDAVAEVKDRLAVDEVVGEYVQLKPAGRNLKGLCPFHNEKTPSFTVSPDKGIYHCFGCGQGGDIFTFVEKIEGLSFREALEMLARKAGVDLPEQGQDGGESAKKHKQRLYEALDTASQYYHIQLSRDETARDYVLNTRGYTKETVKLFKLGWAPGSGSKLANFLKDRGFSKQEMLDAGLVRMRGSSLQDVFRGRVVVPFFDGQGRIVGFTGRVIGDGMPKYLNTQQTKVFDKSRFVFGLFQAKESMRRENEAVVVEGNLDVLSSHQAGVRWVVAMSGTAVTLHQLKQLSRFTKSIVFAFDSDSAGIAATERAIPIAQEAGVDLSIVTLPNGEDPDDVIRKDPQSWKDLIESKKYVVDWLLETLSVHYDLENARDKKEFTTRISDTLRRLSDPVEKAHYVEVTANIIGVSPTAIEQKLSQSRPKTHQTKRSKFESQDAPIRDEIDTVARALASLAICYPDTRSALEDIMFDELDSDTKSLLAFLRGYQEDLGTDSMPDGLQSLENYVKILLLRGEEEYGSWSLLDRQVEAFSLSHRLKELQTKRQKKRISQEIAAAEAAGDDELRMKLLKRYQELTRQ